ncbi:flagellar basal body-associated protein FliL (plasmid) [Hafnia alvei]|uniref:flagellar basal body-associated protein FliL n=1 Tax=Hafnia alvei TaxID=569 RepID=UPI0028BEA4A8|nr:flagellar basal body-associated protein FliL [Hafnia alvei]WNN54665.1 flagellar basal body-associated protein FliL [Hafnia alvei]
MARKKQNSREEKNKFPFLLLLMMSLTISATAFAGYMWFEHQKVKEVLLDQTSGKVSNVTVESAEPIYFPLETFTLSLKPSAQESARVLYIGLTLKLANDMSKNNIEKFLPEIRSRLLMLFSQQIASELLSDDGKQQLVSQIKNVVNKPLNDHENVQVTDVLLNAFILR